MVTARRSAVVPLLAIGGLAAAISAEVLIRLRDLPGATHLAGIAALYLAWWIALTGAVRRVSGTPLRWFTVLLPMVGGLIVLIGEVAIAMDQPSFGELSSFALLLLVAVPFVTTFAAHRERLRWKSGLVAWSLLLYQASISIAGLTGILFGTFGDESRADEMVFVAIIPPLIALLVATASAPGLTTPERVAAGTLVLIAVPSVLFSTSDGGPGLLLAVVAFGGLFVMVDRIGRRPRTP